MSCLQPEEVVSISSIRLKVLPEFGDIVDHIVFSTETQSFEKVIHVEVHPGHEYTKVFSPFLSMPTRDQPSVALEYRTLQGQLSDYSIAVDLSNAMTEAEGEGPGEKKISVIGENIELVIGVPSFPYEVPTPSSDILSICPRLRLLVIGNSGAGKSSLIKKMFGIQDVDISDRRRGEADIDKELVAANNLPFVLHDTLGFEAADRTNLDKVKRFVEERQKKENIKDRLHAVWVCLAVPYAKGRFTEYSTEEFLRDRKKILGDIPLVVALTQVDLLDKMLITRVRIEGNVVKSIDEARPYVEPRRNQFLDEYCTRPLLKVSKDYLAHVPVSTETRFGLEPTLTEIMKVTISKMEQFIRAEQGRAK